jgi:DNA-binding XRE family transcriptional regulator
MQAIELLKLRRKAGLKQAELGKRIGYSRQSIISWEREVHPVPAAAIPRIIEACTAQAAQSETTKAERELIGDTVDSYKKMRADTLSHAQIIHRWQTAGFAPHPEAQRLILEAYPDILETT